LQYWQQSMRNLATRHRLIRMRENVAGQTATFSVVQTKESPAADGDNQRI
jgi:hypothetical protein